MSATAMVAIEAGSEWPAHQGDVTNVVGLGLFGEDLLERTHTKLDVLHRRH